MTDGRWDVPRTEEGLQILLARLEESRVGGDESMIGDGLLALSRQVKRVRSDDGTPPFDRVRVLAEEALDLFRRLGDTYGQASALFEIALVASREERTRLLAEADRLVPGWVDERMVAHSLVSQATSHHLSDRERVCDFLREAAAIFIRVNRKRDAAAALDRLASYAEGHREKYEAAFEAARLYREDGEPEPASRSALIAFINGKEFLSVSELESLAQQELDYARADGSHTAKVIAYILFIQVAEAKGDEEEAARYRQCLEDLGNPDDLPVEDWRTSMISMKRELIDVSRKQGFEDLARTYEAELKQLEEEE